MSTKRFAITARYMLRQVLKKGGLSSVLSLSFFLHSLKQGISILQSMLAHSLVILEIKLKQ